MARLACRSCSIPWINHPRAFGIFVEGNLLDNFGMQSLEYFCLNFWRKLDLKRAKRNGFEHWSSRARRRTARRHVGASYPGCACTPRRRSDRRSEARAARHYALAPVTHAWRRRLVPCGHGRLAPAGAAFRHWPSAPPHIATALRPSPSSRSPCNYRATASARPRAYKTPPLLSPRAPEAIAAACH
jgi:hypothetical protein